MVVNSWLCPDPLHILPGTSPRHWQILWLNDRIEARHGDAITGPFAEVRANTRLMGALKDGGNMGIICGIYISYR